MIHNYQKPIIAVNCDLIDKATLKDGERLYLKTAYITAVEKAGAVPMIFAPLRERVDITTLMGPVRGLVLVGGNDVDPGLYGQQPHPSTRPMSARRQEWDFELIRYALACRLPLLAICAGHQELNVFLGGTLLQHVPEQTSGQIVHIRAADLIRQGREQEHPVVIAANSRLGRLIEAGEIMVNSSHHQSVDRLGHGLRPVAFSGDGLVEAMELMAPGINQFLLSVQWHPERLIHRPEHLALFTALIEAANDYRPPASHR